ncbi:MAG TPA: 3-keto-5-aminohexanoate cleavage protein [Actinomycetota bacterium]|nr:3-keto-5-aminohexanoate cleavage protein [Actinomycetota bacterium]
MLLQAALNGGLTKETHPATPVSAEELAKDACACVSAGAEAIHVHPRDFEGRQRLEPELVDKVGVRVREACQAPVGVSTGAWIEPDIQRRIDLVAAWRAPDYASVNLSEPGATEVMKALIGAGVGVEAGIWTIEDAERLAASGLSEQVTRILVEVQPVDRAAAVEEANAIHGALDALGMAAPRLQHGHGDAAWVVLRDAIRRGVDTRIGLEDTVKELTGRMTTGNEALVRVARTLGA